MAAPAEFLQYIEDNADAFIHRLAAPVIPSASGGGKRPGGTAQISHWLNEQLKALGVDTKLVNPRKQALDGQEGLPLTVLGALGTDPSKQNVLIYGHFDDQPVDEDELDGNADGSEVGQELSGSILGWLNVLQYHHENETPLPVNLRFCFEAMGESDSIGLDDPVPQEKHIPLPVNLSFCFEAMGESDSTGLGELVQNETKPGGYFDNVVCVLIADNWSNAKAPVHVQVSSDGLPCSANFKITVAAPEPDQDYEDFGGTVYEPMTELTQLLGKLVDAQGNILVPGIKATVSPVDRKEKASYGRLNDRVADLGKAAGKTLGLTSSKVPVESLRGRTARASSLPLVHGVKLPLISSSARSAQTHTPAKASGKLSIRLIPAQTPKVVGPLIIAYLKSEFAKLNSKSTLLIECLGKTCDADQKDRSSEVKKAINAVYGQDLDLTREGGPIPRAVAQTFAESLGVDVVYLPISRGVNSTSEKGDRSEFIQGTKLLGSYLYELAALTKL